MSAGGVGNRTRLIGAGAWIASDKLLLCVKRTLFGNRHAMAVLLAAAPTSSIQWPRYSA
ncbi:hypothetical protein SLEP1_g58945 [Rubroshorea leprosula]|uniref:Uncharacterized protein n=1 Tax=Rubroshorea leprosula TaxID=152421 RepID=A0AAV5MV09_9ROSI|nr:hypothetical protein SLEP1_g58945 [Rubroshorea leprosula]